MSGVICDRRVPARVKGKVYKVAVRPAMLYGLETVALTKRQEAEMEVAELKMLRFSLGVTRMDKIRNEYIRGTAQVGKFGEKTREAKLRWYGLGLERIRQVTNTIRIAIQGGEYDTYREYTFSQRLN